MVPELTNKIKDKKLRYKAYQERSLKELQVFKKILEASLKNDQLLVEIN